jgi:hypothetical protein
MQCFVGGSGRENLMFFFAKKTQDVCGVVVKGMYIPVQQQQ